MSLLTALPEQRSECAAVSAQANTTVGSPSVSHILRARKSLHIDCSNEHRCLRAGSRFEQGDVILVLEGLLSHAPSRYSVQVGADLHVQPAPGIPEDSVRAAWRFLNHSCRPNASFRGPVLTALEAIAIGQEITFNYNTTEAEMAEPFVCRCGHCSGTTVSGFRNLSAAERARLGPMVASYLFEPNAQLTPAEPKARVIVPRAGGR
jgi:hypothetical protein